MKKYFIVLIIPYCLFSQPLDESVSKLSEYIISPHFENIIRVNNDIDALDSLFIEAVKYQNGDVSEALLTIAFSALAFQYLPIQVPIIGLKLNLPLSHVDEKLFQKKIDNLPKNLFFNSPKSKFGDKDKIAHFFGSAYLSNTVTLFKLSKFMGIFVEFFEAAFKVEGFLDYRDMKINNLGELYGIALRENQNLLPSEILRVYNLFYFRLTN
ncbi:MAG: hypothetical protein QY331_08945 [Melioribacteraceae bacterium]|nr:hypothetical protein [Melioribacteraceae bacterium]WKZ68080.1 MAG: hypothetical protein QY331_08945 [Melioribacteraceae bacterium]